MLLVVSPVFFRDRAKIAQSALRHGVPAGGIVGGAEVGLLLSFGVDPSVNWRMGR
jgi:hypothetical protein